MVVFTCNHCGEAVHKPKVQKHITTQCKRRHLPASLCCMDCTRDFNEHTVGEHTRCVSELERYSKPGTVIKGCSDKGERVQASWVNVVQSLKRKQGLRREVVELIKAISGFTNVPRRKERFCNFVSNTFRSYRSSKTLIETTFDVIDAEFKKCKGSEQEKGQEEGKEGEGSKNHDAAIEQGQEKNMNKKRKREGNAPKEETVTTEEYDSDKAAEEPKKKKKKSKEKEGDSAASETAPKEEEVKQSLGEELEEAGDEHGEKKKKKRKKHKRGTFQGVEFEGEQSVSGATETEQKKEQADGGRVVGTGQPEHSATEGKEARNGFKCEEEEVSLTNLLKKERKLLRKIRKSDPKAESAVEEGEGAKELQMEKETSKIGVADGAGIGESKDGKKRKRKRDISAETECPTLEEPKIEPLDTEDVPNVQVQVFKWHRTMRDILRNAVNNEMPKKQLRKKVISEYRVVASDYKTRKELKTLFEKKVAKYGDLSCVAGTVHLIQ